MTVMAILISKTGIAWEACGHWHRTPAKAKSCPRIQSLQKAYGGSIEVRTCQ